jgi:adenylate kinase
MLTKLILLGAPGVGKGTIAKLLAEKHNIPHISTGDIFRANVQNKTALGRQVESILASGGYVPDELTIALVQDRLSQANCQAGFILDGFPRTLAQAEALKNFAHIDIALNLKLATKEIILRLSGRLLCPICGVGYHTQHHPPKITGKCDKCDATLIKRKDDEPEAIQARLVIYQEQTSPLIQFYTNLNLLTTIDASHTPKEVLSLVETLLQA